MYSWNNISALSTAWHLRAQHDRLSPLNEVPFIFCYCESPTNLCNLDVAGFNRLIGEFWTIKKPGIQVVSSALS